MPQIIIDLSEKENEDIEKGLREVFGIHAARKKTPELAKHALKDYLRGAQAIIKQKIAANSTKHPPNELAKLRYRTTDGSFVLLVKMNRNHLFNAIRKLERKAATTLDNNKRPYNSAADAFPSYPGFAGFKDLVAMFKWHRENGTNPTKK